MRVKACDFLNLGHGNAHFFGQSPQMRRGQMPMRVLDQVQKFDQKITPTRPITKQRTHIRKRKILILATLRTHTPTTATRFPNTFGFIE
jgi:hypothetical protein